MERVFALFVLSAVAILILPIPPALMDLLLCANLAGSLTLLLVSLEMGDALRVASFPTLLLVSTVFRLTLNISTSRLVLLHGDAGAVVRAFGEFVVQGNPLVGGIVFLIITVVQFVVIAKGGERVAEVTARFTLDAMPGKQMSIDADLRGGLIDGVEAARRRGQLEREAQFYGAMDGAMKFVKGDAVAGLVIVVVNILGGLLVGVGQHGMELPAAVAHYTVLTIGDGLASQVPALLVSVAAGLVITRVRPEKSGAGLGSEVLRQVGAHPEALLLAGGALSGLGVIPGMPSVSFLVLGGATVTLGLWLRTRGRRDLADCVESAPREGGPCLFLDPAISPQEIAPRLEELRRGLEEDLGIPVPAVRLAAGAPGRWRLEVDQAPVAAGALSERNVPWARLEQVLRESAFRFVGVQEVQDLLDRLERTQPALVREIVPRLIPPVLLAEVLSRLVEEGVPIRNLKGILLSLAEHARRESDPVQLSERVREALRPIISHRLAPDGSLQPLLLDPAIEEALAKGLSREGAGSSLSLPPEQGEAILSALERVLRASTGKPTVVLTRPELRRPFWKLATNLCRTIFVVSYGELEPTVSLKPAGVIRLALETKR